ncbi:MAG: hypothetical protein RL020_1619, partial [Pseudomonadota bacterium]
KITWITSLLGSLALIGFPGFSGFFSKDSIIEAVHFSHIPGAGFAYFAVMAGVFVTAFYSFRMYFMVFHGAPRFDTHAAHDAHDDHAHDDHGHHGGVPHESPWVVWLPLVLLAIPSVLIGWLTIEPMLFGGFFNNVIAVAPRHDVMPEMAKLFSEHHGPGGMAMQGVIHLPFELAALGVFCAWLFYLKKPAIPAWFKQTFSPLYTLLDNKYYFDKFNDWFFANGARKLGSGLWRFGDVTIIDGLMVNGSAKLIGWFSTVARRGQTGFIYHYAFVMIIGVAAFLWLKRA